MKSKTLFLTRAALLAAVMCILAPISIPIGPVPITLGVFAVMLAGTILNWKEAGTAVLVYLLLGVIGLPVFSSGKSGPAVLVGPTGGYLWTFLIMAIIIALFSEKDRGNRVLETVLAAAGCLIALLLGVVLTVYVAVTRTEAISRQIGEGSAPKNATKLGCAKAAHQVWLAMAGVMVVALLLMIFSATKAFGYTLAAGVVAAAFAAPLMRLFQIAFMAISNKPAMFGKTK